MFGRALQGQMRTIITVSAPWSMYQLWTALQNNGPNHLDLWLNQAVALSVGGWLIAVPLSYAAIELGWRKEPQSLLTVPAAAVS